VETTILSRLGQRLGRSGRPAKGFRLLLLALATFAAIALAPAQASAMGNPFTKNRGQVLGGLRFGSDDLNFGLGVKAGYTLPMDLYVGGSFDYFFGDSEESTIGGVHNEWSYSAWLLTPEVGYDFGIIPQLMVRPFGGIGLVRVNVDACWSRDNQNFCEDRSDSDVGLVLGGIISYSVGPVFFGGELRFLIYDDEAVVLGLHAGGAF
jgi:hypothetical protein